MVDHVFYNVSLLDMEFHFPLNAKQIRKRLRFLQGETQQPSDYINVMDIFMMVIPFILLLVDRILGDQSCLIGNKDTGFTPSK